MNDYRYLLEDPGELDLPKPNSPYELTLLPVPADPFPAIDNSSPVFNTAAPTFNASPIPMSLPAGDTSGLSGERSGPVRSVPTSIGAPSGIPAEVQRRADQAAFFAQLSNLTGGLGQRGRNFRPDPMAPEAARSAVLGDYLSRMQAQQQMSLSQRAARAQEARIALEQQRLRAMMRPKVLTPEEQALRSAQVSKAQTESQLARKKLEGLESEGEQKANLIDLINTAMGKTVATKAMSLPTLEDMASEIGLDPLRFRRAQAAGGIGNVTYSSAKFPEIAEAKNREIQSRLLLLDPEQQRTVQSIMGSSASDKEKRTALEPYEKKMDLKETELNRAAEQFFSKLYDPEKDMNGLFSAIDNLRKTLDRYPDYQGWNQLTSTIRNLGIPGKWVINLTAAFDEPSKEILMAIDRYKEEYARARSGAVINPSEWENFSYQLGAGVFSSPQTLRTGMDRAENVLRGAMLRAWKTGVDPRVRESYRNRVKHLLPKSGQAWDAKE